MSLDTNGDPWRPIQDPYVVEGMYFHSMISEATAGPLGRPAPRFSKTRNLSSPHSAQRLVAGRIYSIWDPPDHLTLGKISTPLRMLLLGGVIGLLSLRESNVDHV